MNLSWAPGVFLSSGLKWSPWEIKRWRGVRNSKFISPYWIIIKPGTRTRGVLFGFSTKKTLESSRCQVLAQPLGAEFPGTQCACHPPGLSQMCSMLPSVQFSSVAQSRLTLCDPMDCSTPDFPVYHQLPELTQTHIHRPQKQTIPGVLRSKCLVLVT